jgi:hypothetical protein
LEKNLEWNKGFLALKSLEMNEICCSIYMEYVGIQIRVKWFSIHAKRIWSECEKSVTCQPSKLSQIMHFKSQLTSGDLVKHV